MKNALTFQGITFSDRQIRATQAASSASLDGRSVEVDTAALTVKTGSEIYGLVTSEGYPLYTSDGYRLCVSEGYALTQWSQAQPIDFLRGGSQYARWYPRALRQLGGDFYTLSATSPLGLLTQTEHRGGVYAGREAGGLIREICGDVPVCVSPVFEQVPLYGWLPYVSPSGLKNALKGSAKDNLLRVLFALNAMLRADAEGVLRVENLSAGVSSVIGRDRIYKTGFSVLDETPVTSLTLLEHQYTPGAGTETTTLFEGTTEDGQVIPFRDPMSALEATGFSVLENGANYAIVSAGTGTLTGTPYIHTTREVTRPVSESDTENIVRIEDATLVGITNSADVADRMAEYYKHRKRINVDATVEFERPGDVISVFDPVARLMREACIEKISPLNVSHTMKGKLTAVVGFTPWQTMPFRDMRELITESGTWTAPAGLLPGTTVTAYLISGGDGGADGDPGEDGEGFSGTQRFPRGTTGTYQFGAGSGGEGGAGGAPGNGGRILRISLTADPLQNFAVMIGEGGAANGGLGKATTFGAYTSADGAPVATGLIDPITNDVYARAGKSGLAGANGGNGGTAGRDGNAGKDAGENAGGAGGRGFSSNLTNDDVEIGGGGGSGASVTAGGLPGGNGVFTGAGSTHGYLTSTGANGVSGGAREAPLNYGDGGHGGHGGSGGGGAGAALYRIRGSGLGLDVSVTLRGYGGSGGAGGSSSAGVQGCVLLFYRVPITD